MLFVAIGVGSVPSALSAQLAATAVVQSDYRFRGRSLSQGKPVATIDVSYDDRSGLYVGASATAVFGGVEVAGLLAQQAYAGYAIRNKSGASFDVGVVAVRFTSLYGGGREDSYTEAYIGVSKGAVSTQIRFAPSYFGRNTPVVYAELAATRELASDWHLNGRVGVLAQTSGSPSLGGKSARYDVGIGVSRTFGRLELAADWTLGGPAGSYYDGPWKGRSAVVVAVRRSFWRTQEMRYQCAELSPRWRVPACDWLAPAGRVSIRVPTVTAAPSGRGSADAHYAIELTSRLSWFATGGFR